MSKRMTVVFDDEDLYKAIKFEAVRTGRPAKDLISQAMREWLEEQEDAELRVGLDEIREDLKKNGGREVGEFFRELRASRTRKAKR